MINISQQQIAVHYVHGFLDRSAVDERANAVFRESNAQFPLSLLVFENIEVLDVIHKVVSYVFGAHIEVGSEPWTLGVDTSHVKPKDFEIAVLVESIEPPVHVREIDAIAVERPLRQTRWMASVDKGKEVQPLVELTFEHNPAATVGMQREDRGGFLTRLRRAAHHDGGGDHLFTAGQVCNDRLAAVHVESEVNG